MLTPNDVKHLRPEIQQTAIERGERRLDEQCALATAQDGRIVLVLSTAVSLAALAAVFAAAALSFPGRTRAVLVATLIAMGGFTLVSGFALKAIRSPRFQTSGSAPAQVIEACSSESFDAARCLWICKLDRRVGVNEAILSQRGRWLTWAAWTFMLTRPYALIIGWLAAIRLA